MTAPALPTQRTSDETDVDVDITHEPVCESRIPCDRVATWVGRLGCGCNLTWLMCTPCKTESEAGADVFRQSIVHTACHRLADITWRPL